MRRLGLSVLLVLSLAACGPMVSTQPQPPDTDTATLRIAPEPPGVIFFAGTADVLNPKLTISGADLRANAPAYCKVVGPQIVCTVASVPAGKSFVLPITGSGVHANATYQRAQGGHVFTRQTP